MKKSTYIIVVALTLCATLFAYSCLAQSWRRLPGGNLNGSVMGVISFGGYLWVGGTFNQAGILPAGNVVRHDGYQWIPVPGLPGTPFGFCVLNDSLYAYGGFDIGSERYALMKWDGGGWLPYGAMSGNSGTFVSVAAVFNNEIIIGGRFSAVDSVVTEYLAMFNGTSWRQFPGSTPGSWQGQPSIMSLHSSNGHLYIGGSFSMVCGVWAACAAKWDGISWAPLSVSNNCFVGDFITHGGGTYAVGSFMQAGPAISQAVAKEGVVDWQNVGGGVKMQAFAAEEYLGKLYVAGKYAGGNGANVGNCAYWNGSAWVRDNVGLQNYGSETIDELYADQQNNTLYAIGDFMDHLGDSASYIAYKGEVALPVELISFTCAFEDDAVSCEWSTASETNADYFSLSYSEDAIAYKEIVTIPAHGTTSLANDYSFAYTPDKISGIHYLKLRQYDWDGTCAGVWDCAVRIKPTSKLHFNSQTNIISCNNCPDELRIHAMNGFEMTRARSPIYVGDYKPGIYIVGDYTMEEVITFVVGLK